MPHLQPGQVFVSDNLRPTCCRRWCGWEEAVAPHWPVASMMMRQGDLLYTVNAHGVCEILEDREDAAEDYLAEEAAAVVHDPALVRDIQQVVYDRVHNHHDERMFGRIITLFYGE